MRQFPEELGMGMGISRPHLWRFSRYTCTCPICTCQTLGLTMAPFDPATSLREGYDSLASSYEKLSMGQKAAVIAAGGLLTAGAINKLCILSSSYKKKPSSFELSGGSIESRKVKSEFDNYSAAYGEAGTKEGIRDRCEPCQQIA